MKNFTTEEAKPKKEAYLTAFSSKNWNEGKVMNKEGKKDHSLTTCQACLLFSSQLQSTFPLSKVCRGARRGPLTELNANAKRQCLKEPKITKRILKSIEEAIFATYYEKCKENFQKSLSDILVLVPEGGL